MNAEQWFYAKTDTRQRFGPVSAEKITQLIQRGQLLDTDYVWQQGMANWVPLSQVKSRFAQQSPPLQEDEFTGLPPLSADFSDISSIGGSGAPGPGDIKVDFDLGEPVSKRMPYPKGGLGGGGGGALGENAGFWRRVVAYLIDSVVLICVSLPIAFIFIWPQLQQLFSALEKMQQGGPPPIAPLLGNPLVPLLLGVVLPCLYGALMESSGLQATLGKLAIGICVADAGGGRISFGRALGRNFVKIATAVLCSVLCCGIPVLYVVAAFTPQKQAIHDLVAGTFVVRK